MKLKYGMTLLLAMSLTLSLSGLAQAGDDSASSAVSSIQLSTLALGPVGSTTSLYCMQKTHYTKGKDSREVYKRFTKCLVEMIPDWGKGSTEAFKWTGKNLVSIPDSTKGTSEGTTEGFSGAEQEALILAVQEDLMGVVGGAEPSALSEQFMELKREQLGQDLSVEQLAAETIRELEAVRAELQ